MNICKNCKHFDNSKLLFECKRPLGLSLVTGEPKYRNILAEIERGLNTTGCGEVGKFFEEAKK
jgi:hypothetical protein